MAQTYGRLPSEILALRPGSWEAYQLDRAALTLADRVDTAVNTAASAAARSRHDDGGRGIERAMIAVLDPQPAHFQDTGPRVMYDLHQDGEISWRYEHEQPPPGSTPMQAGI